MSRRSPIVGTGGTVAEALAAVTAPSDDVRAYLAELYRLCTLVQLRFDVLATQAIHETDRFTSYWWRARRNPAGIGITGDPTQNDASHIWRNGTDAARSHVAHMIAYTGHAGDWPTAELCTPSEHDPRWDAVQDAGFAGSVRVLGDLGDGRWAADPEYAEHIVIRANQIFAEKGSSMADIVFGKVPKPDHVDSHLNSNNPMIGYSTQPIVIEGVVWHRMIGTLLGTDGWFHAGHAATAYGIGVAATDGTGNAGKIYEWIDPANGHYYGESSGPVSNPYGDGLTFVQRFGVGRVNPQTVAIEISGNYETPLDEAARASIVQLTAYFADQRKIPWSEFPNVPGQDRSFVHWHQEFTIGTGKVCPGAVVMNETPALIQRVAGVLKQYQAGGTVPQPPQYAKSALPEWFAESVEAAHPSDQSEDGIKYYVCRRNFVAKSGTRRMSAPDGTAERSGPSLKLAEKVHGERYVVTPESTWILTNDGHFVSASKLAPPVKIG